MPMFMPPIQPLTVNVAPVNGATVAMPAYQGSVVCHLQPATDLASLTVNLPDIPEGRVAHIVTDKNIALLTLAGFTVMNTVVAMTSGDCISFLRMAGSTFAHMV